MDKPIVVGYGRSPESDSALRWAVAEAELHRAPLEVLHVLEWPVTTQPGDVDWITPQQRLEIKSDLEAAVAQAAGTALPVTVVDGPIVAVLCQRSAQSRLVVMGTHDSGLFPGSLLGSRALTVAVHAACPVVVVRGEQSGNKLPIVVGIDGSPQAQRAAQFAFSEAHARQCDVIAIRAWHPQPDPTEELQTAERHELREALRDAHSAFPEVAYSLRAVAGKPAKVLVEASGQAQLVVTGSRGMDTFEGLVLGSVGLRLLHHAHCPVAIVR